MDRRNDIETKLKNLQRRNATMTYQLFQLGQMEVKIHNQTQELLRMKKNTKQAIDRILKELNEKE